MRARNTSSVFWGRFGRVDSRRANHVPAAMRGNGGSGGHADLGQARP